MSKSKTARLRASSKIIKERKRSSGAAPIEKLAALHEPLVSSQPQADAPKPEMINHPPHYKRGGLECVDIVEAMAYGWRPQTALRLGQAVQYLFRYQHKGDLSDALADLKKAVWWIQREIDALPNSAHNPPPY